MPTYGWHRRCYPPSPPGGGSPMISCTAHVVKHFLQKKSLFFVRFFLTPCRLSRSKSRFAPKKSKKKRTKDVDDARIRPHTLRMKTGIDWNDLVDVKVDGGTSTVAFVTSAYHREWKRYLTEDECDAVTAKYGAKIYEMEFDKKY